MKRLVVVLSSLLVLPAFAEVAPSQYDTENMFAGIEFDDVDTGIIESDVSQEALPDTNDARPVSNVSGRAGVARSATVARSGMNQRSATGRTTATRANTVRSRNISSRVNSNPVRTTSVSTRRVAADSASGSKRSGSAARAATLNTTTTVYNPNAVVQPRSTSSAARVSTISARGSAMRSASLSSSTVTPTAESAIETTTELDTIKSLTEYCQAQYASCMDNYCNVLDDNQGRCSCSKNIKNYEKTEIALENATAALQDIAREIKYIGLTPDQITTLFEETEAELAMGNAKDNSDIHSSLEKVRRSVVDVKSGTASSSADSVNTLGFDTSGLLDFDIDGFNFDFSSFFNTTSSNTNSISNQRGESLYKTASARCKASVLNSCTAQGVDAAVVTNSYDLEIDKSCLAYERALTESNKQMTQTVANAKEVLKAARLTVALKKNAYDDVKKCVSALETCMQDDYVCGSDYEGCLDPTGQYIVNGAVVVGSMPGNNTETVSANQDQSISSTYSHEGLFKTWLADDDKNPWYKNPGDTTKYITLVDYINETVNLSNAQNASDKMSAYLQNKIGWHDSKNNKDYGMCMSVLNQCQNYTYDDKGNYKGDNDVIKQFLQRALIQIKSKQDTLLASYAESCINDVENCLDSNYYDEANPESTKSRTAINSCYSQIKTCMSVNGNVFGNVEPNALRTWVTGTYGSLETVENNDGIEAICNSYSADDCDSTIKAYCVRDGTGTVITNICKWDSGTNKCTRNYPENNKAKCE